VKNAVGVIPVKASVPSVGALPFSQIEVKPVQLENALSPILVTEFGIVKFPVKPEQPVNALSPILVTELPIVKLPVKPEHPANVA
jgi:hypothetical protein